MRARPMYAPWSAVANTPCCLEFQGFLACSPCAASASRYRLHSGLRPGPISAKAEIRQDEADDDH